MEYEAMKPFQQRVADEERELRDKFNKLESFIQTETFASLPKDEQDRLQRQRGLMHGYVSVLADRIDHFA